MFTRAAYGRSCIVPTFVRWCISLFKVLRIANLFGRKEKSETAEKELPLE